MGYGWGLSVYGPGAPLAQSMASPTSVHTEGYLGGGGDLEASLRHARLQTPKPVKSKSSTLVHDCPKDSVILASAMTQSGVLGKEMKVYVDNVYM